MKLNDDEATVETERRKLAAQMRKQEDDDSLAMDINKDDLPKLKARLVEQESKKKSTYRINWKTKPPKVRYTWPLLRTDDLLRDSAVIKQHDKEKKIDGLETEIKELSSNCEKIKYNISELSLRDGTEDQVTRLAKQRVELEKAIARKRKELEDLNNN